MPEDYAHGAQPHGVVTVHRLDVRPRDESAWRDGRLWGFARALRCGTARKTIQIYPLSPRGRVHFDRRATVQPAHVTPGRVPRRPAPSDGHVSPIIGLYGTPIIMPHSCVRTLLTSRWVPRWFSDAAVLQHVYIIL